MATAELLAEGLSQFCPTTNHYRCSDGVYLLVTVPTVTPSEMISGLLGITIPQQIAQMPVDVDVFLSDEDGTAIDADTGDAAMTPLHRFTGPLTHGEALALSGYEVQT